MALKGKAAGGTEVAIIMKLETLTWCGLQVSTME